MSEAPVYRSERVTLPVLLTLDIDYRDGERDWVLAEALAAIRTDFGGGDVDHGVYGYRVVSVVAEDPAAGGCPRCHGPRMYVEVHDSYACVGCNIWLEAGCGCDRCEARPLNPTPVTSGGRVGNNTTGGTR